MILDEYREENNAAALEDVREEWLLKFLREELDSVRSVREEVAQALHIAIAREESFMENKSVSGFGFVEKMFHLGEGGHERIEARREKVEGIYKLRAQIQALDEQVQRLQDQVKEADTRRGNAHQKIWNAIPKNSATQNEAGVLAKEALYDLAKRLDPLNTECLNTICKFIQRTPWFHIVHNFVPLPPNSTPTVQITGTSVSEAEVEQELTKIIPHGVHNFRHLSDKLNYLDALVEAAGRQNARAGRELLSVLHDDTIDVTLQQHLARSITEKARFIAAADEAKMHATRRRCAMTAHWPTSDGGTKHLGAYDWVCKATERIAEDVRQVTVVALRVTHPNRGVLAQVGKWFADGHWEASFVMPGTKVRLDETKETTVKRVLAGHLYLLKPGIQFHPDEEPEYDVKESESATFCIRSRYHRYIYKCHFSTKTHALGPEYLNPIRTSDVRMLSEEFGPWALKAFVLPNYRETDSAIICAFVPESLLEQWLDPKHKSQTKATLQRWLGHLRLEPPQAEKRQGYEIANRPEKPETKIARVLRTIDEKFSAAVKRDSLLHISFECCLVLRKIALRRVQELAEQKVALYGRKDSDPPPLHWFERRECAGKICEMARCGNSMACDLIVERLLQEEQWAVRQHVATELCKILRTLQEENPYIIPFVSQLARLLFHLPRAKAEKQEFETVQATIEEALITQIPSYAPGVRDTVLAQLVQDCTVFERHTNCRPVLDRILQGTGYKIPSSAPISGAPTKRRGNV